MRTVGTVAIGLVLSLAAPPRHAAAQEVGEPVIIVPHGRHQVIIPPIPPRHHPPAPIKLTSISAEIDVRGQVAATTLVMVLSNPGHVQQEAVVLAPVPDGASIRSFQLDSLGPEPTAKLLPREEARRIYDSIVATMRDPGLLEFAGYGLIRSSVFPVPPGGTQTVRLTYEALLGADGDRIDYFLPRSEGLGASETAWTISAAIRSDRPILTVYSPSHEVVVERHAPGHVSVKPAKDAAANPGSFRLSYLLGASEGLSATVLAYPDPELGAGAGYFMLLGGLPAELPDRAKAVKREVTIVIDRSGSMRGPKMDQAREAARQVLEGLEEGEHFNIIDYSDTIAMFAPGPVAKDAASMAEAREYLKGLRASGGTNIHDALVEALRQPPSGGDPAPLPVVLFLTDGLPTIGRTGEGEIRDAAKTANTHERRIFTFGVGYDVNAPLLSGVAAASRGATTFVLPEEDVEVKVSQVFRRLSGPILASPKLVVLDAEGKETTRGVREVLPHLLPDLFEGDQVVLLGQYIGEGARMLRLSGQFLGEPRSFDFPLETARATTVNSFVPRLWATRKIGALIDEIRQAAADGDSMDESRKKELVDEIVRLSIRHGVLTEYTAFLAVEPGHEGRLDFSDAPAMRLQLGENLERRAERAREGMAAVAQERNLQAMRAPLDGLVFGGGGAGYFGEDSNWVRARGIRQVGDLTFMQQDGRWIDTRGIDQAAEPPARTVRFGTPEYDELVARLVRENRQGVLSLSDDVVLFIDGQNILVTAPGK